MLPARRGLSATTKAATPLTGPLTSPLVVIVAALLLWAGGDVMTRFLTTHRRSLERATAGYLTAVTETRAQLAGLVHETAEDQVLQQNIDWQLAHGQSSALTAHLRRAELDTLSIVNADCRTLVFAAIDSATPPSCPSELGVSGGGPGFFWFKTKEAPTLGLVRPLKSGKRDLWMIGTVTLDADWLAIKGDLGAILDRFELLIGGEDGRLIVEEGSATDGTFLASLRSRATIDAILSRTAGSETSRPPMAGPCLIAALTALFLHLARLRLGNHRLLRERRSIMQWALATTGFELDPNSPVPSNELTTVRAAVTTAIDRVRRERDRAKRQASDLERELKEIRLQLARQTRRLADVAELDSLAEQLARTTATFLSRMRDLLSRCDDLAKEAQDESCRLATALRDGMESWRDGVAQRGARKFFRGLSETTGKNPDQTRLDEELQHFLVLVGEIHASATRQAAEAAAAAQAADVSTRIVNLWHNIVLPTDRLAPPSNLLEPVAAAQELVRMELPLRGTSFANALDDSPNESLPEASKSVWVTALYHIYIAQAEALGGQAVIATRTRNDQLRRMVVVQPVDDGLLQRGKERLGHDRQAYHIEIARSVLAPFGITVKALPAIEGPCPIVLSWELSPNGRRVSDRASDTPAPQASGAHSPPSIASHRGV